MQGISDVWGKRQTIESELNKVLTCSPATFERAYSDLCKTVEAYYTAKFLNDFTVAFKRLNQSYLAGFMD